MKAIWLARRDDWSRLITPISGTRAVFTLGARSHQSNLAQPKGKSEPFRGFRSEEHTSELQSLMRISYAVFCLKKKTTQNNNKIIQVTYKNKQHLIESSN